MSELEPTRPAAGWGSALVVAAWVLVGVGLAAGVLLGAGGGPDATLEHERAEAARAALAALEGVRASALRSAARADQGELEAASALATARATELAWAATPVLGAGELLLTGDGRRLAMAGDGLAAGATVAEARPALAAALAGGSTPEQRSGWAWARGGAGPRIAAVSWSVPAPPLDTSLDALAGGLVQLSLPVAEPRLGRRSRLALLLGLGGLWALLGAVWYRRRVGWPLAAAASSARDRLHGGRSGPDAGAGAPEVRAVAATLSAALDAIDHARAEARAETERAVGSVVTGLEAMAAGELWGRADPDGAEAGEGGGPSLALEAARTSLRGRVQTLHSAARETTEAAAAVTHGARRIAAGVRDELEGLRRVSEAAREAEASVSRAAGELEAALDAFRDLGAEQRRVSEGLRAGMAQSARRALDLWSVAGQVERGLGQLAAIDEALDLLDAVGRSAGAGGAEAEVLRARAATAARRARQAAEHLRRDAGGLRTELEEVAQRLDALVAEVPEPAEARGQAVHALHTAALALVAGVERVAESVTVVERAARGTQAGVERTLAGAEAAARLSPRLEGAVAGLDLGPDGDAVLLRRLEEAQQELARARAEGGLSTEASSLADEIAQAATEARGRIARLLDATESAAESIRGL